MVARRPGRRASSGPGRSTSSSTTTSRCTRCSASNCSAPTTTMRRRRRSLRSKSGSRTLRTTKMSQDQFQAGLFELCDMWVATIDAGDYVAFLDDLLREASSSTSPPSQSKWTLAVVGRSHSPVSPRSNRHPQRHPGRRRPLYRRRPSPCMTPRRRLLHHPLRKAYPDVEDDALDMPSFETDPAPSPSPPPPPPLVSTHHVLTDAELRKRLSPRRLSSRRVCSTSSPSRTCCSTPPRARASSRSSATPRP